MKNKTFIFICLLLAHVSATIKHQHKAKKADPPQLPGDSRCNAKPQGLCLNRLEYGCGGEWQSGLCSGDSLRKCCHSGAPISIFEKPVDQVENGLPTEPVVVSQAENNPLGNSHPFWTASDGVTVIGWEFKTCRHNSDEVCRYYGGVKGIVPEEELGDFLSPSQVRIALNNIFHEGGGKFGAINTYDNQRFSWGSFQASAKAGVMGKLLCFIKDDSPAEFNAYFKLNGVDCDGNDITIDGQSFGSLAAMANHLRTLPEKIGAFFLAGNNHNIAVSQLKFWKGDFLSKSWFKTCGCRVGRGGEVGTCVDKNVCRSDGHTATPGHCGGYGADIQCCTPAYLFGGKNPVFGDYVTSEFGRGVLSRATNWVPSLVDNWFCSYLDENPNLRDPDNWDQQAEAGMVNWFSVKRVEYAPEKNRSTYWDFGQHPPLRQERGSYIDTVESNNNNDDDDVTTDDENDDDPTDAQDDNECEDDDYVCQVVKVCSDCLQDASQPKCDHCELLYQCNDQPCQLLEGCQLCHTLLDDDDTSYVPHVCDLIPHDGCHSFAEQAGNHDDNQSDEDEEEYDDRECENAGGFCADSTSLSCNGKWKTGKCGGGRSRQCCVEFDDSKCHAQGGACAFTSEECDGGSFSTGLCGGPSDRQCCKVPEGL